MTVYAAPGAAGAKIAYKPQYNNFIGGKFVPVAKSKLSVLASGSNISVKPTRILRSAYLAR